MLDSIESAIEDIRKGKAVIVVDDEDRENEGDFIIAASKITPEGINFMSKLGRGLICVPISAALAERLDLPLMVSKNTALHATSFTVSIDLLGHGCGTGISAHDRSRTILAMLDDTMQPGNFGRPGHIFPLIASEGGVLRRSGHTEAAIDLARLAGLEPAGVLVEIINEDGTMARLPQLEVLAQEQGLKIISIKDLIEYRLRSESLIEEEMRTEFPSHYGNFTMVVFKERDSDELHFALCKGEWKENEPVLARVHSGCLMGDIFGSRLCHCGAKLRTAMEMIEKEGKGVVVFLNNEDRGSRLLDKLKAYKLRKDKITTETLSTGDSPSATAITQRDYGVGAQILRHLNATKIRLMGSNPSKHSGLGGFGVEIIECMPIDLYAKEQKPAM